MIEMNTWRFMLIILSFYISINFVFNIYYAIGIEHLDGISTDSELVKFGQAIFLVRKLSLP
jgi:inward rectifier potassium channel